MWSVKVKNAIMNIPQLEMQTLEVLDMGRTAMPGRTTRISVPARLGYVGDAQTMVWPDEVDAARPQGRRRDAVFGPFKREYPSSILHYLGEGVLVNKTVTEARRTPAGSYRTQFIVDEITYVYINVLPDRTRVTRTKTLYLVKYEGYDLDYGKWDSSPDDSPETFLKNCIITGDWASQARLQADCPSLLLAWEYMKAAKVFPWMRGVAGQHFPMRIFLEEDMNIQYMSDGDSD